VWRVRVDVAPVDVDRNRFLPVLKEFHNSALTLARRGKNENQENTR
jgi:hypothetical protein